MPVGGIDDRIDKMRKQRESYDRETERAERRMMVGRPEYNGKVIRVDNSEAACVVAKVVCPPFVGAQVGAVVGFCIPLPATTIVGGVLGFVIGCIVSLALGQKPAPQRIAAKVPIKELETSESNPKEEDKKL